MIKSLLVAFIALTTPIAATSAAHIDQPMGTADQE